MPDKIRELIDTLHQHTAEQLIVSTRLVTCKSVDWENRTMICTGVSDDLDYNDVLLGLGAIQIKPKVNTICLIGIIENKDAEAFLIDAEEADEIALKAIKTTFNDGVNKGLVKIEILKQELVKLDSNMTILKNATAAVAGALNTLVPGTTAAFNTAIGFMQEQNLEQLENDKIEH